MTDLTLKRRKALNRALTEFYRVEAKQKKINQTEAQIVKRKVNCS